MTRLRQVSVRLVLAVVVLAGMAAQRAEAAEPQPALFAANAVSKFFGSLNNRTRIVQFCVAVMALGLFILIKKCAPTDDTSLATRRFPPTLADEDDTRNCNRDSQPVS